MKLWPFVFFIVLFWSVARFWNLDSVPPGFYADESAGAAQTLCMSERGVDLDGQPYPLFFKGLSGGYTPTYIYPQILWTKIFGSSIGAFRAFSAVVSLLTFLLVGILAYGVGGLSYGSLALLLGAISPWSFQFSRIAWDPPLMPLFMIGALCLLFRRSLWTVVLAGICLSLAAYAYAGGKIISPLLILLCYFFEAPRKLSKRETGLLAASFFIVSIPIFLASLSGETLERYYLSIFARHPLWPFQIKSLAAIFKEIFTNLFAHFSPNFLFLYGDRNIRHSSGVGELSWVDLFAMMSLLALLIKKIPLNRWFAFLCTMLLVGVLPAAVTWDGIPHALRSIGAWPFWALFSGYILWTASVRWKCILPITVSVALFFSIFFMKNYFGSYPRYSEAWFDASIRNDAETSAREKNWKPFLEKNVSYHWQSKVYYLMNLGGESCEKAIQLSHP